MPEPISRADITRVAQPQWAWRSDDDGAVDGVDAVQSVCMREERTLGVSVFESMNAWFSFRRVVWCDRGR